MPSTITDQVRGAQSSLAIKAPCRVGTTGNITLDALQTIDTVALAEGDRVLVSAQTNPVENGVYIASATPWVRAPDFASTNDVVQGTQVRVMQGASAFGLYYLSTAAPAIDTTPLTFLLDTTTASAAAAYAATAQAAAQQAQAFAAAAGGNAPINSQIHAAVEKTTLADADEFGEADSEATFAVKRITWLSIKTALNALFLSLTGGTLTGALVINKNAGAAPAAPAATTVLQLSGADATSVGMTMDSVAGNAFYNGRRVNTSRAAPSALVNNDIIMRVGALGMSDALGTAARAAVDLLAAETWTATANGTKLSFKTTPAGSAVLTEAMTLDGAGNLNVTGSVKVNGVAVSNISVQTFDASGTWTKPASGTMAMIECWQGGQAGEKRTVSSNSIVNAGGGNGGTGGLYTRMFIPLALLSATETVTIGAGGAGVTIVGGTQNVGGHSTFGAHLSSADTSDTSVPYDGELPAGGGIGINTNTSTPATVGSNSKVAGPGGGGSGGSGGTSRAGGTSSSGRSGPGGAGNNGANAGAAGTQPAGGGGGSYTGTSGPGGNGRVMISIW